MTRTLRTLAHVVRADFLERVRRHGFLVTLAVTLWFAYVFLPPNGARYVTLEIAGMRGSYGSAWVGAGVAMLASSFLSLAGFYLVKNAIARDRATGVGQVLASTPLPTALYTLGKAASNFAVLASMVLVLACGAAGMQWLRAEDRVVDVPALLAPFAVVTLPALAVVAAVAVLFESIRPLRGGLGNVAYFFVWSALVATGVHGGTRDHFAGIGDFLGVSALLPSMTDAVAAHAPGVDVRHASFNMGFNFAAGARRLVTFPWAGPHWSLHVLSGRAVWFAMAPALGLLAAIPFDRFDTPASARVPRMRRGAQAALAESAEAQATTPAPSALDLPPTRRGGTWRALVRAELWLAIAPMPWAWRAVAVALALACTLAPLALARAWLLPFAWIWPVLVWSPMGARETMHGTAALLDSAPRPLVRRLGATWAAGATIALLMGAGVGIRLLATGDAPVALAWLGGALFAPTLAIACGTWTGNGRLFEIAYLLFWYVGPMNHTPPLDFAATTDATLAAGAPARFAAATAVLAALAVAGRARKLRA